MTQDAKRVEILAGERVQHLRSRQGWTQDELARKLKERGFSSWTRSVIAALENGGKSVDLSELVALCLVFDIGLAELLVDDVEWVSLADGVEIRATALGKLLAGSRVSDLRDDDLRGADRPRTDGQQLRSEILNQAKSRSRSRGLGQTAQFEKWLVAGQGELEKYVARQLGADPSVIGLASLLCWGRSASQERDRRAESRPHAKQHVGRQIVRELKDRLTGCRNNWVVQMPDGARIFVEMKASRCNADLAVETPNGEMLFLDIKYARRRHSPDAKGRRDDSQKSNTRRHVIA